ncbi:Ig-like domain-containing protein [Mariniflexile sp.]|uniref:Ig-like domain-containing protein n=1 Tax=Mariniflexile sp. TaxID=1979402 RepID=UPI0040473A39
MKKNFSFRYAKFFAIYIMVFLWGTMVASAQCPTVTNSNPPPICNGGGYTFANLSTDYAPGAVWYSAATGGIRYSSSGLVPQGIYYAGNNAGNCGTRQSVTVTFQVDPVPPIGASLDKFYCSNDNATIQNYIDDALVGYVPVGGSVRVYYNAALTNQANTTDAITNGVVNLFIVFSDGTTPTPCTSQIKFGKSIQSISPPDPTPPPSQEYCSDANPTIGNLNPGTTGTYNWYDQVDALGKPVPPILQASEPLVNGIYYVQVNDINCSSNAVPVTVTINDPYDPGTSTTLDYCEDNLPPTPFDLFDALGGSPDNNGTWTGPITTTNGFQGTVDISTSPPNIYTFTYTVPANGACPQTASNVTIAIYESFSSGTDLSPVTFCESTAPAAFNLFALLSGQDAGGQWTQGTLSTDPPINSPIDLTGFAPNTYNFTYTQNGLPNPCLEESTTVQVIILPDPNAGVAVNQTFCENELTANSPFDLFDALDGSQDNGGTWTDASNTTVPDPLNLDITGFTVAGSPYNFTYTVDNGTCTDDETITITIEPAPESGTPNPAAEFCEATAPASFDLFTLLEGEDQTGTWYIGTDNTGATTPNPVNLSSLTANTYNFTYDVAAIGSCDDELVTVQVIINPLPNTGTPNNPPPFCENDPLLNNTAFDLFTLLSGPVDSGGTWTDDGTSNALTLNNVDLSTLAIGTFDFTYTVTDGNGCSNSTTVTIVIDDAPESGTPNPAAEFCEATAPASFDLFTLLEGEDQTGTWYIGTDNTGATTPNPVNLSSLTANTYNFTYDVAAIGSCDDELVTVQVIINPLPNTGTPNNPPPFCENDPLLNNTAFDLFTLLSGPVDSGGTWTDDGTSNALTLNNVNLSLLTIGVYNFTYNITDANTCTNSTTVTITIVDAPESGTANPPAEFCISNITTSQTVDLYSLLTGEDQTGTWSDDDASGALNGNLVTIEGLSANTYNFTYDVAAIGNCDDVNVMVTIVINDSPAPPAASPQEFCDTATVAELVATGTTIQWYNVSTGGTPLMGTTALVDGQLYYATQTNATTGCESSVRTPVTAIIYLSPNAGNPNATAIVACNTNNAIDLFMGLDGTQDTGGTWSNDNGIGILVGNTLNAIGVIPGDYQFTYLVTASSPCMDSSSTITITIEPPLNAGTDTTLEVCSTNGTTDLFTLIGAADLGGTWSPAMASGSGVFDPLVDASGIYTYSLTNSCGTDTSQVTVTVTPAANAGADNTVNVCVIEGITDLFTFLGTSAQTGGTWSPALASATGAFDPLVDTAGIYTYLVTATSPCTLDSSAQITVTVSDSPVPVALNLNPEFCKADNPKVSDLDASISVTGTISWYADASLSMPLNATEALVDGEDYFARQTTASGCESSKYVQITATVNDVATPTQINPNLELCINDGPTILNLTLNISQYNSNTDNVIWYDTQTGGTPLASSSLLSYGATYYAVLFDASTGCESSIRLEVMPNVTSCGRIALPDGFSPNGDAVNDTFDYNNLDIIYPNFEMEIYNRYGNIVFKGNASSPRFDGTSNQARTLIKGDLPVGVYFYIFNYNDGKNKPAQGRLYLSR